MSLSFEQNIYTYNIVSYFIIWIKYSIFLYLILVLIVLHHSAYQC